MVHSVKTRKRALELRGAGWSYEKTAAFILEELGVRVAAGTIWHWENEPKKTRAYRKKQAAAQRARWDKKNPGRRCEHCGAVKRGRRRTA